MVVKEFHILTQGGCLYKNVKILTENGFATSSVDVYWILQAKGFIYILLEEKKEPIRLDKRNIYYFCVSRNYNKKDKKNISQI